MGVDLLRQNLNAIDVLLTDLTMPGKDGVDLISEALIILPELPFLILSGDGRALKEAKSRGLSVKGQNLMDKPYKISELIERLKSLVN
jgi:DNA-binding response OmpR family regulator